MCGGIYYYSQREAAFQTNLFRYSSQPTTVINQNQQVPTANPVVQVPISSTNNSAGWKTYNDSQLGISFQYPASLNSNYASLVSVSAISDNTKIDSKGCYEASSGRGGPWDDSKDTVVTLHGIAFCVSSGSDAAAGSARTSYYYTNTTSRNGNISYITLVYTVGTSNGCGALYGGSGYQACQNFFANDYNSIVIQPIQKSVSTLTFTRIGN